MSETLSEFLLEQISIDEMTADHRPAHLADWATFGPERTRVECEIKRRIIKLHIPSDQNRAYSRTGSPDTCVACVGFHADMDCENDPWPCRTLRILALPYADHPDFRDEWGAK